MPATIAIHGTPESNALIVCTGTVKYKKVTEMGAGFNYFEETFPGNRESWKDTLQSHLDRYFTKSKDMPSYCVLVQGDPLQQRGGVATVPVYNGVKPIREGADQDEQYRMAVREAVQDAKVRKRPLFIQLLGIEVYGWDPAKAAQLFHEAIQAADPENLVQITINLCDTTHNSHDMQFKAAFETVIAQKSNAEVLDRLRKDLKGCTAEQLYNILTACKAQSTTYTAGAFETTLTENGITIDSAVQLTQAEIVSLKGDINKVLGPKAMAVVGDDLENRTVKQLQDIATFCDSGKRDGKAFNQVLTAHGNVSLSKFGKQCTEKGVHDLYELITTLLQRQRQLDNVEKSLQYRSVTDLQRVSFSTAEEFEATLRDVQKKNRAITLPEGRSLNATEIKRLRAELERQLTVADKRKLKSDRVAWCRDRALAGRAFAKRAYDAVMAERKGPTNSLFAKIPDLPSKTTVSAIVDAGAISPDQFIDIAKSILPQAYVKRLDDASYICTNMQISEDHQQIALKLPGDQGTLTRKSIDANRSEYTLSGSKAPMVAQMNRIAEAFKVACGQRYNLTADEMKANSISNHDCPLAVVLATRIEVVDVKPPTDEAKGVLYKALSDLGFNNIEIRGFKPNAEPAAEPTFPKHALSP